MEKYFVLTVPKGSTVHTATTQKEITGVPDDAFDQLTAGSTWLILKTDAHDFLKKQPKEKLQAALRMRRKQGYLSDVEILEKAIADEAPKKEATADKSDKPAAAGK